METLSVLIIDPKQDDLCRRLLHDSSLFDKPGFATDAATARALYGQNHYDSVLLESGEADDDSLGAIAHVRELDPFCPVIVLTQLDHEEAAARVKALGAADYLGKGSLSTALLERAVRNVVEQSTLKRAMEAQAREQDAFMRTLLHDLRAPLRGASFLADIISDDFRTEVSEPLQEHLELINRSVKRMGNLVDSLSAYTLLDDGMSLTPIDMGDVAEETISNLAPFVRERGANVSCAPLPVVFGHAAQLRCLLQNLVTNGLTYNKSDAPYVEISAASLDERACRIDITDNGIGIPENHLSSIFQPFTRLWPKDVYEGAGLGLALCKKIASLHNGELSCVSQMGKGSRFSLTLEQAD